MASLQTVLYLGVCLSMWIITAADENYPKAEDVRWMSLDFKTILTWKSRSLDYRFTVLYTEEHGSQWFEGQGCILESRLECDLTNQLSYMNRNFTADIKTKPPQTLDYDDYDEEDYPHTYSPIFNPYKESNISSAKFTLNAVDDNMVAVNITDPLSGIHRGGRQLSIRDILNNDLKYKITYYKSGSTGKREIIADSSLATIPNLDTGYSYCFMVAAYIPSRLKSPKLGAWSNQLCMQRQAQELTLGAWVGGIFILLTVLIIIITVTVLCCKCCRQKTNTLQTTQSSGPV